MPGGASVGFVGSSFGDTGFISGSEFSSPKGGKWQRLCLRGRPISIINEMSHE